MSDPMQNLNDAADALNQVAARAAGFYDDADAEIAARQGAYDALAANLVEVVRLQMTYQVTLDPDEQEPTNQDGGVYNSLPQLLSDAPAGSYILATIPPNRTLNISANMTVHQGRHIEFASGQMGAGDVKPKIVFETTEGASNTYWRNLFIGHASSVHFGPVILEVQGPQNGKPFSTVGGAICANNGAHAIVGMNGTEIICDPASALCQPYGGGIMSVGTHSSSLDGGSLLYLHGSFGLGIVSQSALTLTNGATVNNGGILGQSLLKN